MYINLTETLKLSKIKSILIDLFKIKKDFSKKPHRILIVLHPYCDAVMLFACFFLMRKLVARSHALCTSNIKHNILLRGTRNNINGMRVKIEMSYRRSQHVTGPTTATTQII